ncbi:MAG: TRAP transporter large permease subunit, partial [Firmicutes bacterium]|nr:TRAP transporter large permease subunit [Bacillota bacterium]
VALFLTMLCCIVLGMGVPTTANYCIMASTCAPILIAIGVPKIAAHFFVFYFGIVADSSPPVALAAYAGSAIAKSNPMKTGVTATKLAIAAFIIPYVFAINPAMMFIDTNAMEVILIIATSVIGLFGVSTALEGYLLTNLNPVLRIAAAVGGLALIVPGSMTDVIGFVILGVLLATQLIARNKATTAQ